MFRLKRNNNVLINLRNREIGSFATPYRLSLNILYSAVCSDTRNFNKVWHRKTEKRACVDSGFLFCDNFTTCMSLYGLNDQPVCLYRHGKSHPREKVVEAVICPGRQLSDDPSTMLRNKPETHKACLITLTASSWLKSYELERGTLLQEIFLGTLPHNFQFKTCEWETYGERIVLISNCSSGKSFNILAIICLFTVLPLEFCAMMEVDRRVFGKNSGYVQVSDGTIIVGSNVSAKASVNLYDLSHVLRNDVIFHAKMKDPCHWMQDGLVGQYPWGLPFNCFIENLPPMLFSSECLEHVIHFGGQPFHYMVMKPDRTFHIRRISDDIPAENGILKNSDGCDEDFAHFHQDNSSRIVFRTDHNVHLMTVSHSSCSNITRVEESFILNFKKKEPMKAVPPRRTKMTARISTGGSKSMRPARSIMCMDYENELDLIVIMGCDPDSSACIGEISIYDNFTGCLVKTMVLDYTVCDYYHYEIVFDRDTLFVQARYSCTCYIQRLYKLGTIGMHHRRISIN